MHKALASWLTIFFIVGIVALSTEAEHDVKAEKWRRVSTAKEAKAVMLSGDVALVDPKHVNMDTIRDEFGISITFIPGAGSDPLAALAIMPDGEQYIPIYLYGKSQGKPAVDKMYEAVIQTAIHKYKTKRAFAQGYDPESAKDNRYSLQATAIPITTSPEGAPFWSSEYRVYKGREDNRRLDFYYLRADHDYDGSGLARSVDDLFGFKAQWWKGWSNMHLLDPQPHSRSDSHEIAIRLPGGIQWQTDFVSSVDIETDIEIDSDHVIWEVSDYSYFYWANQMISDFDIKDFAFTHTVYLESGEENKGFRINAWYEGWTDMAVDFRNPANAWKIRYDVIYADR